MDVIADYKGERVAVQCKNYRKRVGNKPVQEVYAGARHHDCQGAWVVASAGYTKGAQDLARSTGVSLFEEAHLRRWISGVDKAERARAKASGKQTGPSSPAQRHCAICGAETKPAQAFCASCGTRTTFQTRAGA